MEQVRPPQGGGSGTVQVPALALDRLTVNPRVARSLPFDLARRYRALPVAEDSGRVTVAMADPEDAEAREAILAALGTSACLVSSDPLVIDGLLTEIWPGEARYSLRVATVLPAGAPAAELALYAGRIGDLLKAAVMPVDAAGREGSDWDLAIMPARLPFVANSMHHASAGSRPRAVLFVRQPRWPVRQVLLAMDGDQVSDTSMAWAMRLARPGRAAVTLLAVAPPRPPTGSGSGLYQWLSPSGDAAISRRIRRVARLVADAGIEGRLRLRQGSPAQEIGREMAEEAYDLIVAGMSTESRWAQGESISLEALLERATCPVLIT